MKAMDALEAIASNKCRELSPPQLLFLLEFQMEETTEGGRRMLHLKYCPHRFYHRYARSPNEEDQKFSKDFFLKAIHDSQADRVYLCHLEVGKAHAFAAMRFDKQWFLLDSLSNQTVPLDNEATLIHDYQIGGRASVLAVADNSRKTEILHSLTL
jgi:hypothetical protein